MPTHNTPETEARESQVQSQPGYKVGPCLKRKRREKATITMWLNYM